MFIGARNRLCCDAAERDTHYVLLMLSFLLLVAGLAGPEPKPAFEDLREQGLLMSSDFLEAFFAVLLIARTAHGS